jgi:hypothetical protein
VEVLNFETPAQFFGQLTEKRWNIVRTAQGRGTAGARTGPNGSTETSSGFDEDVVVLAALGLLERTESGGAVCPYTSMHIDMYLQAA